jgi:hypothetical protein
MTTYRVNTESGIVESIFEGVVGIQEIAEHIKKLGSDESLPADLRILTDTRNAVFDFNTKSIDLLIEALKNSNIKHTSIKDAIIQDSPDITAYAFIYGKMISHRQNHQLRIFSTISSAINWLLE